MNKNNKRFNLIFFFDNQRHFHFKISANAAIFIAILMFCFISSSIYFIYQSITLAEKFSLQENYTLYIKKELLNFYISEKHKNSNNYFSSFNEKKISNNDENSFSAKILLNKKISLEKQAIVYQPNSIKIKFSLSSKLSDGKTLIGAICLVIKGLNNHGKVKIITIPDNLPLDSSNVPFSCKEGEQVKFSKLRPTEYILIETNKTFKVKKTFVYFSSDEENGIVQNSF